MIFIAKNFSYKSSIVGFIIGASIGLGLLNYNAVFTLGFTLAIAFGFRENINKTRGPKKAPQNL